MRWIILRDYVKPAYRICCLIPPLILPVPFTTAQSPELSADSPIAYSEETGLLIATGNAVFNDENTTVEADEIRYNRETEQIQASGNVRVTREGIRLLAREVNYDARDRTFSAHDFRAGYPPLFIEGESFAGSIDQVNFKDIALYFREPVQSAPKLSIRDGEWVSEEYLRGRGLSLDAFGGFGLPLPGFTYVFGQPTFSIEATLGYQDNLGGYGQSHWLYPFSQSLSLGGNLDFYTERGVLLGPAIEWERPDGLLRFTLNSGWIHDHSSGERGKDILNNRIEQDRGFVDAAFAARNESGSVQFQAMGTFLSDSEILRDFREGIYFNRYQPDTYADFTWQQGNFLFNAFARSRINDGYRVIERLPEVRAEWLPIRLGRTGLVLQAQASATRYRDYLPLLGQIEFPGGGLGLEPLGRDDIPPPPDFLPPEPPPEILDAIRESISYRPQPSPEDRPREPADDPVRIYRSGFQNRLDANATLTRPFHFARGIDLILRAATRWTHWELEGDDGFADERWMAELGFDLSQTLARTYQPRWERFGIERLHHQSRLSLSHRWYPWEPENLDPWFGLDFNPYRAMPPVLDIADMRHIDSRREAHVARIGWEHRFLAAGDGERYRKFLKLNLYQDVLLDAPPWQDEWDAFYTELEFTPLPWLDVLWMQKYQPEDLETEASFFRATVRSADLWSLSLQAEFLETAIEQYQLQGRYRLSENLGVLGQWQYDSRTDAWSLQRYGISRRFGNVWQLDFYVTFTDDDARRSDFSVGLRLHWLSF